MSCLSLLNEILHAFSEYRGNHKLETDSSVLLFFIKDYLIDDAGQQMLTTLDYHWKNEFLIRKSATKNYFDKIKVKDLMTKMNLNIENSPIE